MRTLTQFLKIWKSLVFRQKSSRAQSQASRGLILMHQARWANMQMQQPKPTIYLWMMASCRQSRANAISVLNLLCQRRGEIRSLSKLRLRVLSRLPACVFNHNYRPPRVILSNPTHLQAKSPSSRSESPSSDSQESISNRIPSRNPK